METKESIQLRNLDIEEKEYLARIARQLAYQRLQKNQDFKFLFEEWYLKDEAVRLVHLQGTPANDNESNASHIQRQLISISGLAEKLRIIESLGRDAGAKLEEVRDTRQEIINESDE